MHIPSPLRAAPSAGATPGKFAVHSKTAGKVSPSAKMRQGQGSRVPGMAVVPKIGIQRATPPPPAQMDRFIPNRSASNLDSSSYNMAMGLKDVENVQEASSPAKVSDGAQPTKRGNKKRRTKKRRKTKSEEAAERKKRRPGWK